MLGDDATPRNDWMTLRTTTTASARTRPPALSTSLWMDQKEKIYTLPCNIQTPDSALLAHRDGRVSCFRYPVILSPVVQARARLKKKPQHGILMPRQEQACMRPEMECDAAEAATATSIIATKQSKTRKIHRNSRAKCCYAHPTPTTVKLRLFPTTIN